MNKNIFRLLAMILLLGASQIASAGSSTGKIMGLYVLACPSATEQATCSVGIVRLSVTATGKPACSTASDGYEYAFALNTTAGKAMFQLMMQTQALNGTLTVLGDNNCAAWGDRERVNYVVNFIPQP